MLYCLPVVIYNRRYFPNPVNSMTSRQTATRLMSDLATALEAAKTPENDTSAFLERLADALRNAPLTRNPEQAETIRPEDEWLQIFPPGGAWHDDPLLAGLQEMRQDCRWFRAESFYSGPEHRHFSEHVWGAPIAGEQDALFDSGGAYIALLILIAPHISYPAARTSHRGSLFHAIGQRRLVA